MIRKILKKKSRRNSMVDPDEIFLDSKNIQNFDRQQFEGRMEKPITKRTVIFLGVFFIFFTLIFCVKLFYLQVGKGKEYRERSENNILEKAIIFTERGVIYDRNKKKLAWNEKSPDSSTMTRAYLSPGLSHVVGYVSYPMEDKAGNYWKAEFEGKDGLEKQYDMIIKGENGEKIIETNALGEIQSENIVNAPKAGKELITTIDAQIQTELFKTIKDFAERNSFTGGGGVIMD